MPQVIDPPADDRMLDLDGLVDWCEGPDFDPRDAEGLAQAGVMLRALARNRHFLADMAIAELKSRCIAQRRDNPYSAQVLLLRPPSRHYVLRAAFWPAACDHVVRTSGTAAFLYHVPHDHGFDFLTIGYLGPGYASDHYEYDGDTVTGIAGEPVALRFIARDCLSEGRMLLYRANRDVHVQHPAQSLSVSLNILAATPGQEWRRQYRFDVAQGIIAECMTLSSSQMLLELAVGSGTGNALDLAEDFARRHHEDAMRHTAWAAIADVQPDPVLRLAHLEQGTRSSSPLIRRASRTALQNIHNGHEMDCSAPADAVGSQEQAGGR
ncbi:transposase [Sphingobium sp. AP49]|uniref:hypothetical protein n=1 Tax=Sphingobium sp. AP49 TaxID=1144307 RepID=UPI00026ECB56|nr:hypothetical protein [Sphingobium sp. AP49]WHO38189.1 transposase [Sphingobium sp. AP49]